MEKRRWRINSQFWLRQAETKIQSRLIDGRQKKDTHDAFRKQERECVGEEEESELRFVWCFPSTTNHFLSANFQESEREREREIDDDVFENEKKRQEDTKRKGREKIGRQQKAQIYIKTTKRRAKQ